MTMKTSDAGLFALALHEGIVPAPYRDSVGVWTYGIGHTLGAGYPDPEKMLRGRNAMLLEVPCFKGLDPVHVINALQKGFDGVMAVV